MRTFINSFIQVCMHVLTLSYSYTFVHLHIDLFVHACIQHFMRQVGPEAATGVAPGVAPDKGWGAGLQNMGTRDLL